MRSIVGVQLVARRIASVPTRQSQMYHHCNRMAVENWHLNGVFKPLVQNRGLRTKRRHTSAIEPKTAYIGHELVEKSVKKDAVSAVMIPAFIRVRTLAKKIKQPLDKVLAFLVKKQNRRYHLEWNGHTFSYKNVKEIVLSFEISKRVADHFKVDVKYHQVEPEPYNIADSHLNSHSDEIVPRGPVIAVMGHVDHGKTTLMDSLREHSFIASSEREGITQKINVCEASLEDGIKATFLDTPGHFHFFRMRTSAAQVADIILLVVAVDEGCLLQTEESIGCIEEMNIPSVVCINKMDVFASNGDDHEQEQSKSVVDRVTQQLKSFVALQDTPVIPISAKYKLNLLGLKNEIVKITKTLEGDALSSVQTYVGIQEQVIPQGIVLESVKERGKGLLLRVLIKHGSLQKNDHFVSGMIHGVVRSLRCADSKRSLTSGLPGKVVDITYSQKVKHLDAPIEQEFYVLPSEEAAQVLEQRELRLEFEEKGIALEELRAAEAEENTSEEEPTLTESSGEDDKMNFIILKTDGAGSLATIKDTVDDIPNLMTARIGIGHVTSQDIDVAINQDCPIYGFNIRIRKRERDLAHQRRVKVIIKSTIHDLIADIEQFVKRNAE
uniref:Translation initiation factor IF2 putative n=1 Tax=Albugo laibachii Nc14 TaxID=890382 RepID=F0WN40_9STRA|nr:translation initiation factor IF2 putative [Albugo laibachii Nc14]|eukprot:CCA22728.1 translation initiation factor IF2 putative [Albugo laibachii Nc14]